MGNDRPAVSAAVSWSGACHNGIGVFKEWFLNYYGAACENGHAVISYAADWLRQILTDKNRQ